MNARLAAVVVSLTMLCGAVGAGDTPREVRDGLARRLEARRAADAAIEPACDLSLRAEEGADGSEMRVTLQRRGGKWLAAHAIVPWWRQETQKEKFSFLHRSGILSTDRDKFLYPVDAAKLTLEQGVIKGEMTAALRLQYTQDQRMPPGGRHLFTSAGRWSLLDNWSILNHTTPRTQRYAIDARVLEGVQEVESTLVGGIEEKPVLLRFRTPTHGFGSAEFLSPTWNASVHEADASGVTLAGDALRGVVIARLAPDPWYPKNAMRLKYTLSGKVAHGALSGTFEAEVVGEDEITFSVGEAPPVRPNFRGKKNWSGTLKGLVWPAVEGRYVSSGSLGEYGGRISGVAERDGRPVAAQLGDAATPGELDVQIRALRMAIDQYPYPLELAMAKESAVVPVSVAAAPALADPAAVVERGRVHPSDEQFGPYYGVDAMSADALPPETGRAGAQRWARPTKWQIVGPFPQVDGAAPQLIHPQVRSSVDMGYQAQKDRLDRGFQAPADGILKWTEVPAGEGRLWPPAWRVAGKSAPPPGLPNSFWYAQTKLQSDETREVWLAVDTPDHAVLWVNGRLTWVDAERQWGRRDEAPAVFAVKLEKGRNNLMFRCRDDRGGSWLEMSVCTRGGPRSGEAPASATAPAHSSEKLSTQPDATPPLAWNVEKNTNVAWTFAGALRSDPIVVGERLFAVAEPFDLVCLDKLTGKELWRRQASVFEAISAEAQKQWQAAKSEAEQLAVFQAHLPGAARSKALDRYAKAPPVTDGKLVYVHFATGVTACFAPDGQRKWMVRTGIGNAVLTPHKEQLIVEGATTPEWAKENRLGGEGMTGTTVGRPGHNYGTAGPRRNVAGKQHGLMFLDAATGKAMGAIAMRGDFAGAPFVIPLANGTHRLDLLVTRGGDLIDFDRRARLDQAMDAEADWDWLGVAQAGDTLYCTHEGGESAARFWLSADGQVGHRVLWSSQRLHAYIAGGPGETVCTGGRLYALRFTPEHAKHSPSYAMALEQYDARTSDPLRRRNPVFKGSNTHFALVSAGEYLFIPDRRGAAHSGGTPEERQIVVVQIPQMRIVARNPLPHLAGAPVFDGNRMYIRRESDLLCIAITGAQGQRYQDEVLAEALFQDMYPPVAVPQIPAIAPLALSRVPDGASSIPYSSGETITRWDIAGPFPAHEAPPAELYAAQAPASLNIAGTTQPFKPLDRALISETVRFVNDAQLDDWQQRHVQRRIDVSALPGGEQSVYYLHALLANSQDRFTFWSMEGSGIEVWINGQKLNGAKPVHLKPGLYSLVARLRPRMFGRTDVQAPVDVRKAREAKAVADVKWPATWQVFGPLPEAASLDADELAKVPSKLDLAGAEYRPKPLGTTKDVLDLMPLVTATGAASPVGLSAWCFATIDAPADGKLLMNASADWFMAWYVDGKLVHSTLQEGNRTGSAIVAAHTFGIDVKAGKHILAVLVKPGSKGWSLASAGALVTKDAAALPERFAAAGGLRAPELERRVMPAFKDIEHPEKVRAVRLQQIRDNHANLQWIINTLPGTEQAARAQACLQTLAAP